MARKGGWRRAGSKGRFRYLDARGNPIDDPAKIERIESLVIRLPGRTSGSRPAAGAKLQATGVDKAGRRQYLYHPEFRAQQEQAKFDKLVPLRRGAAGAAAGDGRAHDPRPVRPRARLRGGRPADQHGLVPRRLGPVREDVADARRHADAYAT